MQRHFDKVEEERQAALRAEEERQAAKRAEQEKRKAEEEAKKQAQGPKDEEMKDAPDGQAGDPDMD